MACNDRAMDSACCEDISLVRLLAIVGLIHTIQPIGLFRNLAIDSMMIFVRHGRRSPNVITGTVLCGGFVMTWGMHPACRL